MDKTLFFDYYFDNAEVNAIMIMDSAGSVLDVNQAFTNNFGYNKEELKGKNFDLLFIQGDKEKNKPQLELEMVLATGQAHDENYVVDKAGHAIWCTGEAMLAKDRNGDAYIIKDLVNLQAKKQLQLFLQGTEELLERIVESSRDIPMLVLDGSMKVEKVNTAFLHLFELDEAPQSGSRLADLSHPFWRSEEVKNELRRILVTNQPLKGKEYVLDSRSGGQKRLKIDSRIIEKQGTSGRQIFIILEDLSGKDRSAS